ncbi:putative HTH-type transcriptional regulator YurK [Paenibacillus plantiphilus]|uniref:HTH-type transcriptional regulator YurK n=1 Tax=Paenibacillus plantiphilus TaxID=2905650 RepID=A0ABM9C116_9BACL|nr:GntR family transcriptional regulator [Paenibacillus plantiphilus]CAH1198787.1 putative HTH-type transcriptional regulator YurK [Paenibacillus plantiphilus]
MKLNDASQKPLYLQLKQIIKEDISRGIYEAGQKLPPEAEICKTYGVSRITVRRAITDLVEEGILHSQQGKGSYVREIKEKRELISVGSFSDMTTASGKTPSTQILSNVIIEADEKLAAMFKIKRNDPVLNLHRLLFIDNQPFIIETSYFPLEYLPDLEKYIGESSSTYQILKKRYDIEPAFSEKTLEVILATEYESSLFHCDRGTPLYLIDKITYDQKDRPLHYSKSLYLTNKVIFTINTGKRI